MKRSIENELYKLYESNALVGKARICVVLEGITYSPEWDMANDCWTGAWLIK